MRKNHPRACFISINAYVYFVPETNATPGGAERQLYLLGQELKSEFDVHFLVGDFGQPKVEHRNGVTLHRANKPAAVAPPHRRAVQLRDLYVAMRRADADIYVFRGDKRRAIITYALAKSLGGAWVYNLALDSQAESSESKIDPFDTLYKRALTGADQVVTQTPYQRRRLQETFGIDAKIVPNGYPTMDMETPYEEREFFLYVGRIEREQKRPHLVLDLARRLPDESFVLIGSTESDRAYHEFITTEAESLDNVRFLGKVDPDVIDEYYTRAIALVNTSTEEGFPNTFLEAWRAGTPVASLDVNPGRFVDGASNGYAEEDFTKLVDIVQHLSTSIEHRRELGERGRQYFEQNYHISVTANRYANLLQNCLTENDTGSYRDKMSSWIAGRWL